MTIQRKICSDKSAFIVVYDNEGEPLATASFINILDAKFAMRLIRDVITECGHPAPKILPDKTA